MAKCTEVAVLTVKHLLQCTHTHPYPTHSPLSSPQVVYAGDPLRDFTLTAFLDKIAKKKPKSKSKASAPAASLPFASRAGNASKGQAVGRVFAALAEADVAPEDLYFHRRELEWGFIYVR